MAFICGVDPTGQPGGHASYVQAHARAAAAAGFSPQIFCVGSSSEIELTDFGVLHRVATPVRHLLVAPAYRRPMAAAVADYLTGCGHQPPHVVHGFGLWAAAAARTSAELARRGIETSPVASAYTTVAHEWKGVLRGLRADHGSRAALWYRGWYPWVRTVVPQVERRGYQRAQVVLVNYDSVARLLREAYGPRLRIRRLPYASPTAFGPTAAASRTVVPEPIAHLQPGDAPLVVSVSRHDARKGLDVLIRALAGLREAGVPFRACLVGPGRLLGAHRALASSLGLNGRVAIPGQVPDVTDYLRHADVFVLPSLQEGSGSVALLEALQAGAAIVASACDGIPEDLVDGENALLVPPGDEPALRRALTTLAEDPPRRAELAARARQLYRERFSAGPFIAALRDIYAELGVVA